MRKLLIIFTLGAALTFKTLTANALIPFLVTWGIEAVTATELGPWLVGSATTVGAAIGLIKFTDKSQPPSQQTEIRIQLDPNKPLITPSGWTNPTTPPPTATTVTAPTYLVAGKTAYAASEAAANLVAFDVAMNSSIRVTSGCTVSSETSTDISFTCTAVYKSDGIARTWTSGGTKGTTTTCPKGYTLTSGACNLTDVKQVEKPEKHVDEFVKTADGWQRDPQQNPKDNSYKAYINQNNLTYTNDNGEQVVVHFDKATGSTTVTHSAPDKENNLTRVNTTTIGSDGQPTQNTSTVQNGTGAGTGATGTTGTGGTGGTGGTTTGTGANDYSRTGEAQNAANSTNNKLDSLLGNWGAAPTLTQDNGDLDQLNNSYNSGPNVDSSWIPSLTPSAGPTACKPLPITFKLKSGDLNQDNTEYIDICGKLDLGKEILGWLMAITTILFIYRTFTGVNK